MSDWLNEPSRRAELIAAPGAIVHALWFGRPLCLFSTATPTTWPAPHTFVIAVDWTRDKVTCPTCLSQFAATVDLLRQG